MKRVPVFVLALALVLPWLTAQASAEVMHYSKCKLNDGKTVEDVQAWVNAWRTAP